MKRKSVGIAVVLAALAVLVNVFALKSATVDNDLTLKIADTSDALIAIIDPGAGTIDSDVSFTHTSGYAELSLPTAGFQPKSTYVFAPAFIVKNNSSATRNITLTPQNLPDGVTITFTQADGTTPFSGTGLLANGQLSVGIKIVLDNTVDMVADAGNHTVNIEVKAN